MARDRDDDSYARPVRRLLLTVLVLCLVSLTLIPVLLGATWVHLGNGWLFSAEGGGWEFPLFWAFIQGTSALLGSGAYAVRIPVVNKALGQFA